MISDPLGLMNLEFVCPKCGGGYFGTTHGEKKEGHCQTYQKYGSQCDFVWDRQTEDAKVFKKRKEL